MRGPLGVRLFAVLLLLCLAGASEARYIRHANAVKSEFIVGLAAGTGDAEALARTLGKQYGLQVVRVYEHALAGFHCRGESASAQRLAEDPRVEYVEENYTYQLSALNPRPTVPRGSTGAGAGWTLERISERNEASSLASPGYQYASTGAGVRAYILDSGVKAAHTEFGNRVETGVDVLATTTDSRAYQAQRKPCDDTVAPEGSCSDELCLNGGHGTAVASLLGGSTYGVAPGVTLVPVRVTGCGATGLAAEDLIAGLDWIAGDIQKQTMLKGAVITMSFEVSAAASAGKEAYMAQAPAVLAAIRGVVLSGGVLFAAAGNNPAEPGTSEPANLGEACLNFPAGHAYGNGRSGPHVITVSGTDHNDIRCEGEHCGGSGTRFGYGRCVDIFAPSTDTKVAGIRANGVTDDDNNAQRPVEKSTGTSFAVPQAAGVAARLLEELNLFNRLAPGSTSDAVWNALRDSATRHQVTANDPVGHKSPNRLLYAGGVTIKAQPTIVANENGKARIVVEAVAAQGTTLSYQWYKGRYTDEPNVDEKVDGATSSVYLAPRDQESDYWVRVTQSGTTPLHSDSALIPVTKCPDVGSAALPQITVSDAPHTGSEAPTSRLRRLTVNSPAVTYEWYAGSSGDTTTLLQASSVNAIDVLAEGTYWVRLVNGGCTLDSTTALADRCRYPADIKVALPGRYEPVPNDQVPTLKRMVDLKPTVQVVEGGDTRNYTESLPTLKVANGGSVALTMRVNDGLRFRAFPFFVWRDTDGPEIEARSHLFTKVNQNRLVHAANGSSGSDCATERTLQLEPAGLGRMLVQAPTALTTSLPQNGTTTITARFKDPGQRVEWRQSAHDDSIEPLEGAVVTPAPLPAPLTTSITVGPGTYWVRILDANGVVDDSDIITIRCEDCAHVRDGLVRVNGTPTVYYRPEQKTTPVSMAVPENGTGYDFEWREGADYNDSVPPFATTESTSLPPASPAADPNTSRFFWVRTITPNEDVSDSYAVEIAPPTDEPELIVDVDPPSRAIGIQSEATLTARVVNFCPGTAMTFEWYESDPALPGAQAVGHDAAYRIWNPFDDVTVWVKVTGQAKMNGATTCSDHTLIVPVTIRVLCEPAANVAIQTNPLDSHIGKNESVALSALGFGKSMTYSWYNGALGNTGSLIVHGPGALRQPVVDSKYWVRGEDACRNQSDAEVTIYVCKPAVADLPETVSVTSGSTTPVTAQPTPAQPGQTLSYQWYTGSHSIGWTSIGGATGITYQVGAAGQYRVGVSATCGDGQVVTTYSTVVTAALCYLPTVTVTSADSKANHSAVIGVTATGPGTFTYQWYRGLSGETGDMLAGETFAALEDNPAVTTNYWCMVTSNGSCSTPSATAQIRVCSDPIITASPLGTNTRPNVSTTLTVAASGNVTGYEWYRGEKGDKGSKVIGQTTATLSTGALTADTRFWANVLNGPCETQSESAMVKVCTLEVSVNGAQIASNESATLTATVTNARAGGGLYYRWYRATSGGPVLHTEGPTISSIIVSPGATTSYLVEVMDGTCTRNSNTATVDVCVPRITTQSTGGTIEPNGGYRDLSVTTDVVNSTVQWYEEGQLIAGATQFTYRAQPASTKSYYARVTSPCGRVADSDPMLVTVCSYPTVTVPQTTYYQQSGGSTEIVVNSSDANLTYQWYRGVAPDMSIPVAGNTNRITVAPGFTVQYWARVLQLDTCATNSGQITVDVCTTPSITTQPQSGATPSGTSLRLSVTASASSGLVTYQWYRGPSGNVMNPIQNATNSFYDTPANEPVGTYEYWVKVTRGACSTNSSAATVTVCTGPQFYFASTWWYANCYQLAVSPYAYGAGELTYDWFEGPSGDVSHPLGAGSYSRQVCPTVPTQYWVRVWNPEHTCFTNSAAITVSP